MITHRPPDGKHVAALTPPKQLKRSGTVAL
jgi:hypothetical protein